MSCWICKSFKRYRLMHNADQRVTLYLERQMDYFWMYGNGHIKNHELNITDGNVKISLYRISLHESAV